MVIIFHCLEFSIWHFGDVKLGGIKPGFVLQVRRADESHSKIYINVCSSELIPMSQTENNGHLIYYMVIGEKERGMNGLEVYDVGISEKLMLKLKREPGIKGKVSQNFYVFKKLYISIGFHCLGHRTSPL